MYLVNKEYFFIIPMCYVVCNNQNSLERATIELKKVNIYNQIPTFFSFSENTVGQNKSRQFILFCVIFPFLSNALSLLYKRFLPVRHSSQTAYIFLSPSNCLDSCRLGNGTTLSIGPELNTLLGLRRFWVSLALNQYQSFITV